MPFRYVAIDLDGTLLDERKRISNINVETINRLSTLGVQFIYISGRHFNEIVEPLSTYGILDVHFVVCRDGQYIYKDGKIVHEGGQLSMCDIERILDISGAHHIFCSNTKYDYTIYKSFFRYLKSSLNNRRADGTIHVPLFLAKIKRYIVGKAIFFKGEINRDNINERIKKYYTIHFVNNREYDIFPLDVNKYAALKWLSENENIDLNDLLYFGDDYNDIECFENLSHCIVMGNAPLNLLKYSMLNDVKTNNEDGVAAVLLNLFK